MNRSTSSDVFARIAGQREAHARALLVEPGPPALPDTILPDPLPGAAAAFTPEEKLDTAEKLQRELARQRRRFARFQRDLAPAPPATRIAVPLTEFDYWLADPRSPDVPYGISPRPSDYPLRSAAPTATTQHVSIPHYGGPIGKATACYRTAFDVTEQMLAKGALFVCFRGVDYRAHAFVNGIYLGSHEGFFAPFEFDFTRVARPGENILLARVENDAICMGNDSWDQDAEGDKLYAATGPGWDDPELGWHHCPPGMGIYQPVTIEARAPLHIHDLFVRPIPAEEQAEVWVEVWNATQTPQPVTLQGAVFGQNFRKTVAEGVRHAPPAPAGPGVNYYRFAVAIPRSRIWDLDSPWLYQAQVALLDVTGQVLDAAVRPFGMRSFRMDEQGEPRGRLYLNGREIRLRGANTMGFEQQDVMRGDLARLRDDILLAKICHMNYWRLTQRPVQEEVYTLCDQLGLMTQTDLPLFGYLRRNQFVEAVRQAGEMERLVRGHPCNVLVSYINEPFPYAEGDKTYRHLSRPELESFFVAADQAVRLANPDRVIKPVEGDYDPPAPGLPDNHCYTGWYNGHGVDLGSLHRGYWQRVKPGWLYGCGEFGSEGLDPASLMRRRYPSEWLPRSPEEEREWSPGQIRMAQSGNYHYFFFDTQHSVADWVAASQLHQAWATRLMTEAFRRDARMVSFAIHLFIDAFPAGWMKAIMDCERQPKAAYFAYREALTPLMANLRSDRRAFWAGETTALEAWVCNDLASVPPEGVWLGYQLEHAGRVLASGRTEAQVPRCSSAFQGILHFTAPWVTGRTTFTARLGLLAEDNRSLHDTALELEVFPPLPHGDPAGTVAVLGRPGGPAGRLARDLPLPAAPLDDAAAVLVDDLARYRADEEAILHAVERGATLLCLELPEGEHELAGSTVKVSYCGMNPRHFVSRATGHPAVAAFQPDDFKFWHDPDHDRVTPLLETILTADDPAAGWRPVLTSGDGGWGTAWRPALACIERPYGAGRLIVCQVKLAGRTETNPVAALFARRLLFG